MVLFCQTSGVQRAKEIYLVGYKEKIVPERTNVYVPHRSIHVAECLCTIHTCMKDNFSGKFCKFQVLTLKLAHCVILS